MARRKNIPKVRWDILSLEIGDPVALDGIGADQPLYTGDEILFSPVDLALQYVRLKVPEFNALGRVDAWHGVRVVEGLPRLQTRGSFEPRLMVVRAYDWQEDILHVLSALASSGSVACWRLEVYPGISVLVDGTDVVGWRLDGASRYVGSPISEDIPRLPRKGGETHRCLLGSFLAMVDDEFVQRMEVADTNARTALLQVKHHAQGLVPDGVSEVLESWITDILERFYT